MTDVLQLKTCGGLRISLNDSPVTRLKSRKARILLVYLCYVQVPCSRLSLAQLLWEGSDTRQLLANLRRELFELRQCLPNAVEMTEDTIAFSPHQAVSFDVFNLRDRLSRAAAQFGSGHSLSYAEATALESDLAAYLSAFLPDLEHHGSRAFEAWLLAERRLLQHQVATALQCVVETYAAIGAKGEALRLATRLLQMGWASEPVQRTLKEPLAILHADSGDGVLSSLPNAPEDGRPKPIVALPVQVIPFVGRERELAELSGLLTGPTVRVISLVGLGGIGKTRLAIEASAAQSGAFADGIYFIDLAPLSDPALVQSAIAEGVGFQFQQSKTPRAQLFDFFRDKRLLLLLDNFEHVRQAADLVAEILQAAPGVKLLITSRERLMLEGEWVFPVEGMSVPAEDALADDVPGFGAVQLFIQSLQRLGSGFKVQAEDLVHVSQICRQVQGLPLGILLAAAWANILSLAEISEEISRSLDFLATEAPSVPARQRSLRAVFNHTWTMLDHEEQCVFSRLSVFWGGFTREAAQVVAGATLKTLARLGNKALIRHNSDGRYEIHELVRQFAAARLAEMPAERQAALNQHCLYFAELAGKQTAHLKGANGKAALAMIAADLDNIRAAWDFGLVEGRFEAIDKAAETLGLFFVIKAEHFAESEALFQKACDHLRPRATTPALRLLLARLLAMSAYHSSINLPPEAVAAAFRESEALVQAEGTDYEQAVVRLWWAMARGTNAFSVWRTLGGAEWQSLAELAQTMSAVFESNGDTWRTALTHWVLALSQYNIHALGTAEVAARRALTLFQQLGTRYWQIWPLFILASVVRSTEAAIDYGCQILKLAQDFDDKRSLGDAFQENGYRYGQAGDYPRAKSHLERCLLLRTRAGNRFEQAWVYSNLGYAAETNQLYADAYVYYQQAMCIFQELRRPNDIANQLNNLASAAIGQGRYSLAEMHCREALFISEAVQIRPTRCIESLFHAGYLVAKAGDPFRGVVILTSAFLTLEALVRTGDVYPHMYEQIASLGRRYLSELKADLSCEVFSAAQAEGVALNLSQFVSEFLSSSPWFLKPAFDSQESLHGLAYELDAKASK